ncbi:MAG: zeta toxin family protein [Lentisphaeria bacterium]|nr:zeta toxin family protein [Lentisphaeria bacterium]
MKTEKQPTCYIVAGPNGAGKTTFALQYLPKIVSCNNFINADEIAKGVSPLDFEAGLLQASKIFLKTLNQKIQNKETFAFETTLSGKSYLSQIPKWQQAGWKVVLIYLYIPSAEFSSCRVRQRFEQGGHNVPEDAIIRRYPRSIKNLFLYAAVCDQTLCFNNEQGNIVSIFEQTKGNPMNIYDDISYSRIMEVCSHE